MGQRFMLSDDIEVYDDERGFMFGGFAHHEFPVVFLIIV